MVSDIQISLDNHTMVTRKAIVNNGLAIVFQKTLDGKKPKKLYTITHINSGIALFTNIPKSKVFEDVENLLTLNIDFNRVECRFTTRELALMYDMIYAIENWTFAGQQQLEEYLKQD